MFVNVKEYDALLEMAAQLANVQREVLSTCQEELSEAGRLVEETQAEEQNSKSMLDMARTAEDAAYAAMIAAEGVMLAAEARLAKALAEEAAAVASANPVAIAAATVNTAAAAAAFEEARQAYELAKQTYELAKAHRELLERRYEMAQQAHNLAQLMQTKLQAKCAACQTQIMPLVEQGTSRLQKAHSELQEYHAKHTSVNGLSTTRIVPSHKKSSAQPFAQQSNVKLSATKPSAQSSNVKPSAQSSSSKAYNDWKNYQPKANEPAHVPEINERLNLSKPMMHELLNDLYQNDENFRRQVDAYRSKYNNDRDYVERQSKKNMSGRLAEEIVIGALKPYGTIDETQVKVDVSDGGYSKIDFVLKGLKVPLIFGRGAGMGVREGNDIAIEVKSGKEAYLTQQLEHLKRQAEAHQNYDASWVICTRDIKNVRNEAEYRQALRDAGSPPIGMLPHKSELDEACLDFVREGVDNG